MRKSENPLSPNENIDVFGYQVKTAWLLRFSKHYIFVVVVAWLLARKIYEKCP